MSLGVAKLGDLRCGGHGSATPQAGCELMVQHPCGPGRGGLGLASPLLCLYGLKLGFAEPNPSHSRLCILGR